MKKGIIHLSVVAALLAHSLVAQKAENNSLDQMIGQMIMIGIGDFNRANPNQPIFEGIREGKVGGIVLYEKNLFHENPKTELASLVDIAQKNAPVPLFVSIDEEGGVVTRLKPRYGFPTSVSAQYLGKLNSNDSTRAYAQQTAGLLAGYGVNMNYAPVVDVDINPQNPIIGKIKRSYSSDYKEVVRHAGIVCEEHIKEQVIPVLKHFPGHGSSSTDTHLGVTDVTSSWRVEEMYPYAGLLDSGVVKAVMTAHIVNETLDETKLPATLSEKIINGLLRSFLRYDGVVISDDMLMGAIRNEFGLKESIYLAINAGVDVIMFANTVSEKDRVTASEVHAIISALVREKAVSYERIRESYVRIMNLKREMGLLEEDYYKNLKKRLKTKR